MHKLLSICVSALLVPSIGLADALTWDDVRYGGVVEQGLDNSCGLAALLTLMRYTFSDVRFTEETLLAQYMEQATTNELGLAMRDGLSLRELASLAESVGYSTRSFALSQEQLIKLASQVPVLVYLEVQSLRHFAVVREVGGRVTLADPSRGVVDQSWSQFMKEWDQDNGRGYVMVIVP